MLTTNNKRQWQTIVASFCLGMLVMVTISTLSVSRTPPSTGHPVLQKRGELPARATGNLAATILQFGDPGTARDFLERESYVVSYDRRDRVPSWVGEHLTKNNLLGNGDRKRSKFQEDPDILPIFRSTLDDYSGSGYDRGHMAPAGDAVADQTAMDQTFYLSNMSPQVGIGFNRHCKYLFPPPPPKKNRNGLCDDTVMRLIIFLLIYFLYPI
jgi:endonuclease G